jgi:putative toxin-antitoxin system antitoxin component (TIGR02293 family)
MKTIADIADWSRPAPAELAARGEAGLPVTERVKFGRTAGFTTVEIATLVHIPPRTYARRIAGKAKLDVTEGERAVRLMRLYDRALRVFGGHDRTRAWLQRKLRVLGGRAPLDFAKTEPGAREVENILGRIEHGVFS